jgi:rubrerythrin
MIEARNGGPAIRRRGFLAMGGAGLAATALAACGAEEEEPTSDRDVEILSAALVGEENAASALKVAEREAEGDEAKLITALVGQADDHVARLESALSDLDATPEGEFELFSGGDLNAALAAAIEQTNRAISAYRRGAAELTEDRRAEAIELMAADGARFAAIAQLVGEQPAPYAFVTGGAEPPHQTIEDDEDTDDSEDSSEETTTEDETTTDQTTTEDEG